MLESQRSKFTRTNIEKSRGVCWEVHQDVEGCRCRKYLKYSKSELFPFLCVFINPLKYLGAQYGQYYSPVLVLKGDHVVGNVVLDTPEHTIVFQVIVSNVADLQLKCFTWRPQPSKSSKPTERLTLLAQVDRQVVACNVILSSCRCI